MTRRLLFFAASTIALAACLGLLASGLRLEVRPPGRRAPRLFGKKQQSYVSHTLNFFEKKESAADFELTYGWRDFRSGDAYATFAISKDDLAGAEKEFGYTQKELDRALQERAEKLKVEMIVELKAKAKAWIAQGPYSAHLSVEDKDPYAFNLKLAAPAEIHARVKAEFNRIAALVQEEQKRILKKQEKDLEAARLEFLEGRGLRIMGEKIGVDYGRCVDRNQPRLKLALEALRRVREDASLHDFLGLLVAFIQEIRYGMPDLMEGNKYMLGFWVPPRVLVSNSGDCDSKGVVFGALWKSFKKYPLLIFKIPDHMFIGVAIPSLSEEGTVRLNGLMYTLCEVTGPEKLPPGLITPYSRSYLQSGRFLYEIIR